MVGGRFRGEDILQEHEGNFLGQRKSCEKMAADNEDDGFRSKWDVGLGMASQKDYGTWIMVNEEKGTMWIILET